MIIQRYTLQQTFELFYLTFSFIVLLSLDAYVCRSTPHSLTSSTGTNRKQKHKVVVMVLDWNMHCSTSEGNSSATFCHNCQNKQMLRLMSLWDEGTTDYIISPCSWISLSAVSSHRGSSKRNHLHKTIWERMENTNTCSFFLWFFLCFIHNDAPDSL